MKNIILIILISTSIFSEIFAQPPANVLPEITNVMPYKLEVGYNTTTVIVFPVALVPAGDRGTKEIIIQQEKAMENILKVKATKKDFQPTNLHVYTVNGKMYVFNVIYTEYPTYTTFDLTRLNKNEQALSSLIIKDQILNKSSLMKIIDQSRRSRTFFSRKNTRYEMRLQLQVIHTAGDWLAFRLRIANRSNLDYDVDFIKMFIRDRKQVKRSSLQEQEMVPLYKDDFTKVQGEKETQLIVIVPRFTIPDKKEFYIEVFEKNGGRHISLKIKNKHLLKARAFE